MTDGPDIKSERPPTRAAGIAWRDGDSPRLARTGRIAVPWLVRELVEIERTMFGTGSHRRMVKLLRRLTTPVRP